MSCDEARAQAAAYATGSLSEDERAAVLAHLESCPEAHEEFASMRAAALMLARAAPDREPPADLRDRALGAAFAARASAPSTGSLAGPAEDDQAPPPAIRRTPLVTWWTAAAAAILVFVLGLGGGVLLTGGGDDTARELRVYNAQSGAWLNIEARGEDTELTLGGLPTLDAATAYQLWVIRDGAPRSLAVIEANSAGPWSTNTPIVLGASETVAVTIGPSGGGEAPIGDLLLSSGGA